MLRVSLEAHGYSVLEAASGIDAVESVIQNSPEIVLLDLGLPDLEGMQVTRQLRSFTALPIIILSVRSSETDKIEALDAGADDYLSKPFSTNELLARLRAALRRNSTPPPTGVFIVGSLTVDLGNHEVKVDGREIRLTRTEASLLRVLVLKAGQVLTYGQLLRHVWGEPYTEEHHLLRVNISNLRKKIEPDPVRPNYIVTELGVGYRLKSS
jgi:two-component system KDP operon response regulator KdpE